MQVSLLEDEKKVSVKIQNRLLALRRQVRELESLLLDLAMISLQSDSYSERKAETDAALEYFYEEREKK